MYVYRTLKKLKVFSVSLNRFELRDASNLKIIVIGKLVLNLLISLRVSHKNGALQLSY